jgi:3-oxoacyl-[acyl-carrier protein] reductase
MRPRFKMLFILFILYTDAIWAIESRLANKVAIVTGASQGIGRATAELFAQQGAEVILISRSEKQLAHVVAQIKAKGGKASFIVADVGDEKSMQQMAQTVFKQHGRIDILIHNAGMPGCYLDSKLEEMKTQEWHQILNVNLNSAFYTVRACLPMMKTQKQGRIVFTSSIGGPRVGLPGASHYTAAKAGLNGFMKTIAIEFAHYGITVNAVEPGPTMVEDYRHVKEKYTKYLKQMIRATLMGRLGAPEDIAKAHLFLASDEAAYITGQSIIVDGGMLTQISLSP